ncbi:acyl transferase [Synechocystis salina]|uniref:Acyl transferase n=1 Tax=Synechocystis salina LEGE 00031 TaxID=1828736 RepID=A0ABR9VTK2_9SYNC|nr:acyl transferase [Synechocystis salina]MBE9241241.1 acyl transferase [Synechocystis salina LEGE 00041]MBE9254690.1 acyl transferase [Synechocystis salina LEGE 00031]
MTLLSKLLALFPGLVVTLALICFIAWVMTQDWWWLILLILTIYGLPLLTYRIHQLFYPLQPGFSYLVGKQYSPWWGTYQIQLIYSAFPALERLLHFVPGLFSLWLRLWGSTIGQKVLWTPSIQILDRGMLHIGNQVIFGHQVTFVGHAIKPKQHNLLLYVDRITVGNNVFISAEVGLSPGVAIADGSYIPFGKKIFPRQKVGPEK